MMLLVKHQTWRAFLQPLYKYNYFHAQFYIIIAIIALCIRSQAGYGTLNVTPPPPPTHKGPHACSQFLRKGSAFWAFVWGRFPEKDWEWGFFFFFYNGGSGDGGTSFGTPWFYRGGGGGANSTVLKFNWYTFVHVLCVSTILMHFVGAGNQIRLPTTIITKDMKSKTFKNIFTKLYF